MDNEVNGIGSRPLFIAVRLYLGSGERIVGSKGLVKLLEEIDKTNSIRTASIRAGMNYRKAWSKVTQAEKILGIKLIERGKGRQGSRLTPDARNLIRLYYSLVKTLERITEEQGLPIKII